MISESALRHLPLQSPSLGGIKVKVFKEENYLANWIKIESFRTNSNLSCGNMWGITMVEMMANRTYPINATSIDMLTLLKTRFNFRNFYGYRLYRYWYFASEENDHVRFFPLMLVFSHRYGTLMNGACCLWKARMDTQIWWWLVATPTVEEHKRSSSRRGGVGTGLTSRER
ncbi:hypothetical protein Sjap_008992 [Stephania japonica]|uniref:Uncharacterized protein n=1 Tax=Stephania japonica TaxID=461633 RepID=A0AAP0PBD3_9MAGN